MVGQDGMAIAQPVGLYTDERQAVEQRDERNRGLQSVMGWPIVGPQGQAGVALGQILSSFGLKGVTFDVMSAEPRGAILTPEKKILLPH